MSNQSASKTDVHCPVCGKFMFTITLLADKVPVGGFGRIDNFRCPNRRCGHQAMVLVGVADKDQRNDREQIEDEMRKQMELPARP